MLDNNKKIKNTGVLRYFLFDFFLKRGYNASYIFDNFVSVKEINLDQISPETITHEYLSAFYNDNVFEVSFLFHSDFKNTKYLREYLLCIGDILGLDNVWKNRFVLIIDELNNNAIEYGSNQKSINKFRLSAKKSANMLDMNIEVEDAGNGKSPKTAQQMEGLRQEKLEIGFDNHQSIRGRGLFLIITKLVDELYFKNASPSGLIVGIHKKIELKKAF